MVRNTNELKGEQGSHLCVCVCVCVWRLSRFLLGLPFRLSFPKEDAMVSMSFSLPPSLHLSISLSHHPSFPPSLPHSLPPSLPPFVILRLWWWWCGVCSNNSTKIVLGNTCIDTYIIYKHIYICIYTYICIHTHICIEMCVYIYICMSCDVCVCVCVCLSAYRIKKRRQPEDNMSR